jgi:hypothetical protein
MEIEEREGSGNKMIIANAAVIVKLCVDYLTRATTHSTMGANT